MLVLTTIALLAYVGFIALDFAHGLLQLWRASAAPAPVAQPQISDPWEGKIETPMITGRQDKPKVTPQLLLAPAKDDLSRLTVAELRRKAQSLKIRGARAMKKSDLLMALS